MKKLFLPAILSICLFTACKKSNDNSGVVVDYFNAYDATYANLNGDWTLAVIPTSTDAPRSRAVSFDHSTSVSFTGFDGNVVKTPYTLSLDNNVFYINIKSADVVKKCQIVKLTRDTLQLHSIVGSTNAVTINELFTHNK